MSKDNKVLSSFKLAGTKEGTIAISNIEEPYGKKSDPVVSIGISLKGNSDDPDWKAHIPHDNLDELIAALQEAKEDLSKS